MRYVILFFHIYYYIIQSFCLEAQEDSFRDPVTKIVYPRLVTVENDHQMLKLSVTGYATRSKFIVNIYSIIHYWEDPLHEGEKAIFEALLTDGKAKQFTIHWLRDVHLSKIRDSFYEAFQKLLSHDQRHHLHGDLDRFLLCFEEDARKGDIYIIRWLPGGRIQLFIKGITKGEIVNTEFAKALWEIWMGPKSIVNRRQLIDLIVTGP
jgi:hypothetical protein